MKDQKKIDDSLKGYRTFSPVVDQLVQQFLLDKSDENAQALLRQMKLESRK